MDILVQQVEPYLLELVAKHSFELLLHMWTMEYFMEIVDYELYSAGDIAEWLSERSQVSYERYLDVLGGEADAPVPLCNRMSTTRTIFDALNTMSIDSTY